MATITPAEQKGFVSMSVVDLNSDHLESGHPENDPLNRSYLLTVDTSAPEKWFSEDGSVDVYLYNYKTAEELWISPQTEEAMAYFADYNLFDMDRMYTENEDMSDYFTGTEDFYGTWKSENTGKIVSFVPVPDSKDCYGLFDYLITVEDEKDDSSIEEALLTFFNVVDEKKDMDSYKIMTRDHDKLLNKAAPFEESYYLLKSYHTIEQYDENQMLIDTLERCQDN